MEEENFAGRLERAEKVGEIFQLVKDCVRHSLGRGRAGLMLGLSPLGFGSQGFIGAYHQLGSNLIVMNSSLLGSIGGEEPSILKHYIFHLLLHEYLHSLGIAEEGRVRALTYTVSRDVLGEGHVATSIAKSFESYLPKLRYPGQEFQPPEHASVTLVPEFDSEGTSYIA